MLSLVVNDALEGVDVARRYPTFYRRMLADPHLRWAFLEALEILEKDRDGSLEPLPDNLDLNLDFLELPPPPAVMLEERPSGGWCLAWQRPGAHLQSLLLASLATPRATYRALATFLEDDRLPLVEDVVAVAGDRVGVLLEAVRCAGAPDDLYLSLLVTAETVDALQATVEWGPFRQTAVVRPFGTFTFPPLPLADVFDEVGRKSAAALCLTLEPAAP